MTWRLQLGLVAIAVAAAAAAWGWLGRPARPDDATLARAVNYRTLDPSLDMDEAVALVGQSAVWHGRAAAEGKTVAELLAETVVSEGEARRWYEDHRELFGDRPFEAVRGSVGKMARLDKLQRRLSGDEGGP